MGQTDQAEIERPPRDLVHLPAHGDRLHLERRHDKEARRLVNREVGIGECDAASRESGCGNFLFGKPGFRKIGVEGFGHPHLLCHKNNRTAGATDYGCSWRDECAAIIRNVSIFLRTIRSIAWLACVVYATIPLFWLVIHPRAGYWRSRKLSPYRILVPLWIAMWMVAGAITAQWRDLTFYTAAWTWLPAVLLFAVGLWIYRRAGAGFSAAQLGGLPELSAGPAEQRLATSGIRARVRHPVYLGHLCEMLAWSLGTGQVVCYGLTAFALVTGAVMIRLEDRELEQRFGEEYRDYRRTVPAVVPRIWTR